MSVRVFRSSARPTANETERRKSGIADGCQIRIFRSTECVSLYLWVRVYVYIYIYIVLYIHSMHALCCMQHRTQCAKLANIRSAHGTLNIGRINAISHRPPTLCVYNIVRCCRWCTPAITIIIILLLLHGWIYSAFFDIFAFGLPGEKNIF